MIFDELQQAVAAALNNNAYFTQSPACPVYWQGQKETEDKKPLETAKAMQSALNALNGYGGAAAMVMCPKITRVSDTIAKANVPVLFLENVFKNRGEGGTGKTAFEYAAKALAVFMGANEDAFSPWSSMLFEDLDDNVDIEHEGLEGWVLTMSCTTLLDTLISVLGDPDAGLIFTNENNQPISVEPTEA